MSTEAIPSREILMVGLASVALFLLLAMLSYSPNDPAFSYSSSQTGVSNWLGHSGAWCADVSLYLFGRVAYLLPLLLVALGVMLLRDRDREFNPWQTGLQTAGAIGVICAITALVQMHTVPGADLPAGNAGILGSGLAAVGLPVFGWVGLTLICVSVLLVGLQAALRFSWLRIAEAIGRRLHALGAFARLRLEHWRDIIHIRWNNWQQKRALQAERAQAREAEAAVAAKVVQIEPSASVAAARQPVTAATVTTIGKAKKPAVKPAPSVQPTLFTAPANAGQGALPELGLLDERVIDQDAGYSGESLEAMSRLLELKLKDFGVDAEVVSVLPGPVVTRFEIQPAAGIKVQKISALAKDLARSLAVISVRIVEIIPGKSYVGIEIPNENREMVRLKEVLETPTFVDPKSPLTLALGKDIAGQPMVADIAKMPHLLVAGTTGSGKSVGVNAMLLSILYKATPEQVRLILVDPKMLELSIYEGIPHLLTPVVTDMTEAAHALNWCVGEMERRYRPMAAQGVRNLEGYNRKILEARAAGEELTDPLWTDETLPAPVLETLPMIVVVIDEFADMMMIVGKKVEELIARLAQKARASGIHLIVATQRPSVDVITGLIKANIPARIAFQVSSRIDSRTILDQMGAEHLLGHGDMLYLPGGTSIPTRIHGAFVDDHEVLNVVKYLKQSGEPNYIDEILSGPSGPIPGLAGEEGAGGENAEQDALYDQAVQIVTQTRKASISGVQRRLKVGYNRAARMVEAMEEAGVVGPVQTNGSREVIAPPPPKD